jgi:hypothetical protein
MLRENYLTKEDSRERGKKVFYSLTEGAKQRRDLKLLSTDPDHTHFQQIYANLFLRSIIEGNTYAAAELEDILKEIHATRQELNIDHFEKRYDEFYDERHELAKVAEKPLPALLTTYYKPTSLGVKIIESVCYRENIFYRNRTEYASYTFTLPGVCTEELAEKYYTFKPPLEYCERALQLLLKRGLVVPIMIFRGKTRYVIADLALNDLMSDLHSFREVVSEFLNLKWQHSIPSYQELQSRKVFILMKESVKDFSIDESYNAMSLNK